MEYLENIFNRIEALSEEHPEDAQELLIELRKLVNKKINEAVRNADPDYLRQGVQEASKTAELFKN